MRVQSKDLKSRRLIGKGLSSMVYETMWEGKSYARKDFLRVPPDIFEREAAALVGLDHPNLVRTYCWAVDERSCSHVLELMGDDLLNMIRKRKHSQRKKSPGSDSASPTSHLIDLQKFIEDGKNALVGTASRSVVIPLVCPFNLEEALQIILQIAEGMKFLHDSGVVHGDLKPKNILFPSSGGVASSSLDENMACKLSDFGLVATKMTSRSLVPRQARKLELVRWRAPELLDFSEDQECESSTKLDWDSDSSTGTISVKVQHMSSEDMKRADVYDFALTCSQILTGEDPCPDLDLNDLVRELSLGLRPELPPTCPPQLSDLIRLCWSERTERPSFQDILSELKDLKASLTRTGSVVDVEKSTITGTSSAQIDSPELELVPENSAVSGQPSERPGGSSDLSPGLEIDQTAEVPFGHENLVIKNIQDNSKGSLALEQESTKRRQGRWRRKAFSSEEMPDFSTPRRHTAWVKRKAKDKRKKNLSEEISWPRESPWDDRVEGERHKHPEHTKIPTYPSTELLSRRTLRCTYLPRKSTFALAPKILFNPVDILILADLDDADVKRFYMLLSDELASTWRYKLKLYKIFSDPLTLPGKRYDLPQSPGVSKRDRLGIVIVTRDFIKLRGPMIELVALVASKEHFPNGIRILPLFIKVTRWELETLLDQGYWDKDWESMALDVLDCRRAVQALIYSLGFEYVDSSNSTYPDFDKEFRNEVLEVVNRESDKMRKHPHKWLQSSSHGICCGEDYLCRG